MHLKPALGDVVLQELTPRMLQLFYNYKAESEGLSAKTIVNLNLFLHRALKFAVAEGYINSNPASSVNLPSGGRPQITILTRDEQMCLIQGSYTLFLVPLPEAFPPARRAQIRLSRSPGKGRRRDSQSCPSPAGAFRSLPGTIHENQL